MRNAADVIIEAPLQNAKHTTCFKYYTVKVLPVGSDRLHFTSMQIITSFWLIIVYLLFLSTAVIKEAGKARFIACKKCVKRFSGSHKLKAQIC